MSYNREDFRHIPQPPHSAGLAYRGLRSAIDPSQIPSFIDTHYKDQARWSREPYMTASEDRVPASCTDYWTIDQGNSTPRFMRLTTYGIPSTSSLASHAGIPLAVIVHPFAEPLPEEEQVPLVDFGENGPPRCRECRAYINPWCTWDHGAGTTWKCNLCGAETEVPSEYFSHLDMNLKRMDLAQRAELNRGTVDFAVPKDYWAQQPATRIVPSFSDPLAHTRVPGTPRSPKPLNYVFLLDISTTSVQSGFLSSACSSILSVLYGDLDQPNTYPPCIPQGSEIAIITFDDVINFYDLSPHLTQASIFVVPDIEDVFVPNYNIFANPITSRHLIENLLTSLPTTHSQTATPTAALGSSLRAGLAALAGRGGHIVAFQSVLPTIGVGALAERTAALGGGGLAGESALYGTDKEKTLFVPQDRSWVDLGEECADEGVGVSLFLAPMRHVDVGTIGAVASTTGGDLFHHPRFEPSRDESVLRSQLRRLVSRPQGYNCAMRIRCSKGLRIKTHLGNFHERAFNDLQFGNLDADKAITALLEHEHALSTRPSRGRPPEVYFQAAVLYTNVDGQRRVRVCNRSVQVVELAGNVYRYGDMDAVATVLAKQAVTQMTGKNLRDIRESITERATQILLSYRRSAAASTPVSQLVMPEDLKLLPLFSLTIIKSKPIKGGNVNSDVRNVHAHGMLSKGVAAMVRYLYPRLLAIHDLSPDVALPPQEGEQLILPWLMRGSYTLMEASGVYLIDNGELIVLWIGTDAATEVLQALYGRDTLFDLKTDEFALQRRDSLLSRQIWAILDHRRTQNGGREAQFLLARQGLDASELEFSNMLVEDQNNDAFSYLDYLCFVHRQIMTIMTGGGGGGGSWSVPW